MRKEKTFRPYNPDEVLLMALVLQPVTCTGPAALTVDVLSAAYR